MKCHLAKHFRTTRLAKSITLGQLARLAGYRNIPKGANRINKFENGGDIRAELLHKLADVLGIDRQTVDRLIDEDRRQFFKEWNAWANEPIRPYLVIRLMAAVYCPHNLPEEIQSVEEAEEYAAAIARERRMRCCLVLSRRISVWIAVDGRIEGVTEAVPGQANTPVTYLGGKPCLMKTLDHGIAVGQIAWPKKGEVKGLGESHR